MFERKPDDHLELKIEPEYLKAQLDGRKNFEIRRNDRDFRVGQLILLRGWIDGQYTGRQTTVEITYITDFCQREGYAVLGTNRAFK